MTKKMSNPEKFQVKINCAFVNTYSAMHDISKTELICLQVGRIYIRIRPNTSIQTNQASALSL